MDYDILAKMMNFMALVEASCKTGAIFNDFVTWLGILEIRLNLTF
jgi:hypothetical protein